MPWEFNSSAPVFLQIAEKLRADILGGKYPPGSQIPPVRTLAAEASVNPNTMQRALGELETSGLLESRGTVGRFVTSDASLLAGSLQDYKQQTLQKLFAEAEAAGITEEEIIAFAESKRRNGKGQ